MLRHDLSAPSRSCFGSKSLPKHPLTLVGLIGALFDHKPGCDDFAVCFWTSSIVAGMPALRGRTAALMLIDVWEECRARCKVKIIGQPKASGHAILRYRLLVWGGI
jgi:hypothetical protein